MGPSLVLPTVSSSPTPLPSASSTSVKINIIINNNNHNTPSCYLFSLHGFKPFTAQSSHRRLQVLLRVTNDSSRTDVSPDATTTTTTTERSEADKIVDGMDFGQLCDEFECISSPSVEATARQLARDILELREGNRALGTYAVSVKYKGIQKMEMLSTSLLNIKWTIRGKPKSLIGSLGGDLIIKVDSKFTLNQVSGQGVEHQESWDVSESSAITQAYFWTSRRLFSTVESGKDVADFVKDLRSKSNTENKNLEMYPDPMGDPTKFFQRDDSFQRDTYQFALFLALIYFVVQFLRTTL